MAKQQTIAEVLKSSAPDVMDSIKPDESVQPSPRSFRTPRRVPSLTAPTLKVSSTVTSNSSRCRRATFRAVPNTAKLARSQVKEHIDPIQTIEKEVRA